MQDFVHLNVHSHYSILKSTITIPSAVDKAIADGQRGMALTDDGVMYGIKEFVDYCAKVNRRRTIEGLEHFKPIIGCEMYVAPRTMHDKEKGDDKCCRLIVLAKNLTGYKNLVKLVSNSWAQGLMNKTPRTDKIELEKYHEGLIVISSNLRGEISENFLKGDLQSAKESLEWYKTIWGDDFYIEIQRHEVKNPNQLANRNVYPLQTRVNGYLLQFAKEYGVKVACSNNCHFINEDDAEGYDRFTCLQSGKDLNDPTRKLCTKQEWLKNRDEMNEAFADVAEVLANTIEILDKVEIYDIGNFSFYPVLPKVTVPEEFGTVEEWHKRFTEQEIVHDLFPYASGNDSSAVERRRKLITRYGGIKELYRKKLESDYLCKLASEGAERIYGSPMPAEVVERLQFELSTIKTWGVQEYFLFWQELVNVVQNELGALTGPGRGPAVGCLVNYCLGITKIDPIKNGLLFERFIDPDHICMPTIELDIDTVGHEKVLQWLKDKYGEDNCVQIITFRKFDATQAIMNAARIEKLPRNRTDVLCRNIADRRETIKKLLTYENYDGSPEFPELVSALISDDPKEANTIRYACELERTIYATGVHECGVIVSPDAITNNVPLAVVNDPFDPGRKAIVSQFDASSVESMGFVRFNLLELRTLTEVKDCVSRIKQNKGLDIDIEHIPIDDEQTFALYQEGRTVGAFQFESPGMQNCLRELHPTVFSDLVTLNALYRPGPMDYIPPFIERKNGREEITYDLPVMEDYLKETFGIPVYQEQIMQMAQKIAGFSRGYSYSMCKAMELRKKDIVDCMKPRFIEGGIKNDHDPKTLEKVWRDWETFAPYYFNKSHAVAYTWLAYQTAYLKAHYPEEYMTSVLLSRLRDQDEVLKLLRECEGMGISISLQKINIEAARRESVKQNKEKQDIMYGIRQTENGYEALKVDDQEAFDFYVVKGNFCTTAGHDVCILDSYFVDPLKANGWRYHASYGCGCFVDLGYFYGVTIEKGKEKIRFRIAEDFRGKKGEDFDSIFASIMVSIAIQCATIEDVEHLISQMELPVGG